MAIEKKNVVRPFLHIPGTRKKDVGFLCEAMPEFLKLDLLECQHSLSFLFFEDFLSRAIPSWLLYMIVLFMWPVRNDLILRGIRGVICGREHCKDGEQMWHGVPEKCVIEVKIDIPNSL